MRKIYFLIPKSGLNSGGHIAQIKFFEVAQSMASVSLVTYKCREEHTLFLSDILANNDTEEAIFVIHWGPDVSGLLKMLTGKNVIYVAHSTGWGFKLPSDVPIIAVSRHTQAYWGRHAPNSPIYYLPNVLSDDFRNLRKNRDIDVLIQKRKSSKYLLEDILPELQSRCSVFLVDSWVDDLAALFNRSKIYLYDSSEYWIGRGKTEGFGLPPLEAIACGCTVFSSVNDALSDYLDPGFNCHKLRVYSKQYDVEQILSALKNWDKDRQDIGFIEEYRKNNVDMRLRKILSEINVFFDRKEKYSTKIEDIQTDNFKEKMRKIVPLFIRKFGGKMFWA
jgi:hypothetical protein